VLCSAIILFYLWYIKAKLSYGKYALKCVTQKHFCEQERR